MTQSTKKIFIISLVSVLIVVILFNINAKTSKYNQKETSTTTKTALIDLEKNICRQDSDCEYEWLFEGCNTPEYIKIKIDELKKSGITLTAPPRREGTCTCESKRCITHFSETTQ